MRFSCGVELVGGGHVEEGYYRRLCKIGAKLALVAPQELLEGKSGRAVRPTST